MGFSAVFIWIEILRYKAVLVWVYSKNEPPLFEPEGIPVFTVYGIFAFL